MDDEKETELNNDSHFETGQKEDEILDQGTVQSDDESDDEEDDNSRTFTFNGQSFASTYQEMVNAKCQRNHDMLKSMGLLAPPLQKQGDLREKRLMFFAVNRKGRKLYMIR